MRIALACVLLGALIGAGVALGQQRDYSARAFVIRVPPLDGAENVLALARSDAVLRRAFELSEVAAPGGPGWLREHSSANLTGRLDLALSVSAPDGEVAAGLATAYAKAVKRAFRSSPGSTPAGWGRDGPRSSAGRWRGA